MLFTLAILVNCAVTCTGRREGAQQRPLLADFPSWRFSASFRAKARKPCGRLPFSFRFLFAWRAAVTRPTNDVNLRPTPFPEEGRLSLAGTQLVAVKHSPRMRRNLEDVGPFHPL